MIKLTFPDGGIKEFEDGIEVIKVAEAISPSLKKKCVAGKLNGNLVDLSTKINEDSSIIFITQDMPEALDILNHSTAHLLAHAMSILYPHAHMGVGPDIEEGFYYDMDLGDVKLTEEDLPKIEKKMQALVASGMEIKREVVSKEEAKEIFKNDVYKLELVNELPDDEVITMYRQGNYVDLCRGPHVSSTKWLKHFKLLSVSGAYWRGDSSKAQLQRVYGTCFMNEESLKEHLQNLEERKKRDHRKLGKELELFMLSEYGPGLPFFLPKGFRRQKNPRLQKPQIFRS